MTPDDLLHAYQAALATQRWGEVEPLMHPDVCVTFSSGRSFRGREEVRKAFTENFAGIQDERYEISEVHWVAKKADHAVCTYEFHWSGLIDGNAARGAGRGTGVLTNEAGRWLILAEHLGPLA